MYVCTYVCMHAQEPVPTCSSRMYVCMYVAMFVCAGVCAYLHVCTCECMNACIFVFAYAPVEINTVCTHGHKIN